MVTVTIKLAVRFCSVVLFGWCFSGVAFAVPSWSANIDEHDGLPTLSRGGAQALSSTFAFWAKNWARADQQTEFTVSGPFEYSIAGRNSTLNIDLTGRIRRASELQFVWEFDLDSHSALAGVIGGGLVFKFDLTGVGAALGDPQL